ncbi:hypothetical protein C8R47DRAFT_1084076 [Mycena vitilis]|nr:hypothetical protein C8R47DRAFT_1084076 [Mycena vitilis]
MDGQRPRPSLFSPQDDTSTLFQTLVVLCWTVLGANQAQSRSNRHETSAGALLRDLDALWFPILFEAVFFKRAPPRLRQTSEDLDSLPEYIRVTAEERLEERETSANLKDRAAESPDVCLQSLYGFTAGCAGLLAASGCVSATITLPQAINCVTPQLSLAFLARSATFAPSGTLPKLEYTYDSCPGSNGCNPGSMNMNMTAMEFADKLPLIGVARAVAPGKKGLFLQQTPSRSAFTSVVIEILLNLLFLSDFFVFSFWGYPLPKCRPLLTKRILPSLWNRRAPRVRKEDNRSVPASLAAWWPVCGQESLAVAGRTPQRRDRTHQAISRQGDVSAVSKESQAIIDNHADILFNAAGDYDEENAEKIGKIDFHIVQQSRMSSQGLDKFEEMEGESRELAQIFEAFFDEEGEPTQDELQEALSRSCFTSVSSHVLPINWVFAEGDILLHRLDPPRTESGADMDKLTQYFGKLGFKMWHDKPNTDLPFMGTWTGYIRPSIENVIVVDAAAMFSTYTIDFVVVCGLTLLRWSCQNPMVQIHCFFMPMRGFNIEKERAINTVKLNRGKIP